MKHVCTKYYLYLSIKQIPSASPVYNFSLYLHHVNKMYQCSCPDVPDAFKSESTCVFVCISCTYLYSSKPFTLWSKNTSTYCTRQPYLISIVCIFVIPVTFAWHLNPPPRRCHAGRTGLRLAVYIGFKSQDQNFPLKTPSSWISVDIYVWWLLFQIGVTPSMLFRCHFG